jgi:uncharacterized membrane protein YbaN (DUF454 family)
MPIASPVVAGSRFARALWFGAGWACVGIGTIGIVVPGLPTTVFFVVAASCFARSSPRFERWVLDLPKIGPMVRDYRAGLGMSRRAKAMAVTTMVVFATLGVVLAVEHLAIGAAIAFLVVIGAWYVLLRVPTREVEQARRRAAADAGPDDLQSGTGSTGTPFAHGCAGDATVATERPRQPS